MKDKKIAMVFWLSCVMLSSNIALGEGKSVFFPRPLDVFGGMDYYSYWSLTDENLIPLEDGDIVQLIWVGEDGAIDPPVDAQGSPYHGQPTGDDKIITILPNGFIEYAMFYLAAISWDVGDLDSLGRQRHPTPGEKIYARVFNSNALTTATYYGDSNLYQVIHVLVETFFAQMPNDPNGPTTNQAFYGRFFKVVGGINPTTGQVFQLRDPSDNLEDGDVVQLIWTGPDGQADFPDHDTRMPSDDDLLLETWGVNEGMWPDSSTSIFRRFTANFDDPSHGRPAQGDKIYVRLLNSNGLLTATYYGDSPAYIVSYVPGESLSVFYDDQVDCGIPLPPLSVELMNFEAIPRDGEVLLMWKTASETNTFGFHLDRSQDAVVFQRITEHIIPGAGNSEVEHIYTYLDEGLVNGTSYYYNLITVNMDGREEMVSDSPLVATPIIHIPTEFVLHQNCPNPFNAATEIRYQILKDGYVTLGVYNTLGQEVRNLVDGQQKAGEYVVKWNGRDAEGREVASGVYFCRMRGGERGKSLKMVLIR